MRWPRSSPIRHAFYRAVHTNGLDHVVLVDHDGTPGAVDLEAIVEILESPLGGLPEVSRAIRGLGRPVVGGEVPAGLRRRFDVRRSAADGSAVSLAARELIGNADVCSVADDGPGHAG